MPVHMPSVTVPASRRTLCASASVAQPVAWRYPRGQPTEPQARASVAREFALDPEPPCVLADAGLFTGPGIRANLKGRRRRPGQARSAIRPESGTVPMRVIRHWQLGLPPIIRGTGGVESTGVYWQLPWNRTMRNSRPPSGHRGHLTLAGSSESTDGMTPVNRKSVPKSGQVQLRAHARAALSSHWQSRSIRPTGMSNPSDP